MHLSPELVDVVADYLAIFVLFFVPALLIYVFWMIHILPEKIAERRGATDFLHVLQIQARRLGTQFDLIAIRNDRLAHRVALHLALGGGFTPSTP